MLFVVAGCGRIGFAPSAEDAASGPRILAIEPRWAPPEGGPIEVVLDHDAAGTSVTIGGAACAQPAIIAADRIRCTVPAHAPATVDVVATSAAGVTAPARFSYLTKGIYQAGGPLDDRTSGVAVDPDGNIYMAGGTTGALDGANAGDFDALLIKYDVTGTVAWTRQLGTPLFDYARDVAVDPSGDITIAGYTAGDLDGPSAGGNDVFAARYSPDGTLRWITQTGTPGDDQAWDLGVDAAGAVVLATRTTGALGGPNAGAMDYAIVRYAPDGSLAWVRQGGTAVDDIGHSITMTADGVAYLVGYTAGAIAATNAGGQDLFVARYEPDGTQRWIRQRGGAGDDQAQDVSVDATGEVWVVGATTGALDGAPNAGGQDVFVTRFTAAGDWVLTRLHGGAGSQTTFGVSVAPDGQVFVACATSGAFAGQPYAGGSDDVCVISMDRDGAHRWTRLFGSAGYEGSSSCAVDAAYTGLLYVSLITDASLDGAPNRGVQDLGLAKLDATGVVR